MSPGAIDTPMFDNVSNKMRLSLTSRVPLNRLGLPDEVATAALFLASADAGVVPLDAKDNDV
ncbi:SDR family oxidoreductase [Caballeronia sp. LjRoot29]|uniref:SDR family oxidoreductase n=1 Tax=Caballeronia sp. LjRoot29 TaxID=3342315 RepID=UPI003F506D48